jgi:hypothetical protein
MALVMLGNMTVLAANQERSEQLKTRSYEWSAKEVKAKQTGI